MSESACLRMRVCVEGKGESNYVCEVGCVAERVEAETAADDKR